MSKSWKHPQNTWVFKCCRAQMDCLWPGCTRIFLTIAEHLDCFHFDSSRQCYRSHFWTYSLALSCKCIHRGELQIAESKAFSRRFHSKNSNIRMCLCETSAKDSYFKGKYLKYLFHRPVIYLFWLNIEVHNSCYPFPLRLTLQWAAGMARRTCQEKRKTKSRATGEAPLKKLK